MKVGRQDGYREPWQRLGCVVFSRFNYGAQCAAMTLVVFAGTPSWVNLIKWK